jgi:hypothetical protein
MVTTRDDRSLGEMFAELSRQIRTLIEQEVLLAKTEVAEKASQMSRSLALVVGGALIAYGGVLAMVAAMVLGLVAAGLAPWAGALVGGALTAGIGYLLVRLGLVALRRQGLKPRQAIAALKEDAQWIKNQTR